ncbi:RRP15-like protein [Melia azedarach]|uniref:RRP15-like protein n=1 Tax=Melia azedarach TaxID=155640 RepID=A0ACC1Z583_MELAZ|nr:RRP15-like protein [Melia azedarach]
MAEEGNRLVVERGPRKRKSSNKKGSKARKKLKVPPGSREKGKINPKMRKLFQKRAREYNSDDDDDEEELAPETRGDSALSAKNLEVEGGDSSEAEGNADSENEDFSDDEENGEIQPGTANFTEGLRAFKMAFKSILKNSVADDALGPVLSAHKKLVAEKLAEEEAELKVKGEAKKEKHLAGEKGHVKPANYLDSHEKFLIGVATKGVVKLFNAVNKAQHAQKGLNPSRSKDAKLIKKRKKETFFSELRKTPVSAADDSSKGHTASGAADSEGPAWAPLRDNYMLTSSKLKDWDKMPESAVADDVGRLSEENGSSDDE